MTISTYPRVDEADPPARARSARVRLRDRPRRLGHDAEGATSRCSLPVPSRRLDVCSIISVMGTSRKVVASATGDTATRASAGCADSASPTILRPVRGAHDQRYARQRRYLAGDPLRVAAGDDDLRPLALLVQPPDRLARARVGPRGDAAGVDHVGFRFVAPGHAAPPPRFLEERANRLRIVLIQTTTESVWKATRFISSAFLHHRRSADSILLPSSRPAPPESGVSRYPQIARESQFRERDPGRGTCRHYSSTAIPGTPRRSRQRVLGMHGIQDPGWPFCPLIRGEREEWTGWSRACSESPRRDGSKGSPMDAPSRLPSLPPRSPDRPTGPPPPPVARPRRAAAGGFRSQGGTPYSWNSSLEGLGPGTPAGIAPVPHRAEIVRSRGRTVIAPDREPAPPDGLRPEQAMRPVSGESPDVLPRDALGAGSMDRWWRPDVQAAAISAQFRPRPTQHRRRIAPGPDHLFADALQHPAARWRGRPRSDDPAPQGIRSFAPPATRARHRWRRRRSRPPPPGTSRAASGSRRDSAAPW